MIQAMASTVMATMPVAPTKTSPSLSPRKLSIRTQAKPSSSSIPKPKHLSSKLLVSVPSLPALAAQIEKAALFDFNLTLPRNTSEREAKGMKGRRRYPTRCQLDSSRELKPIAICHDRALTWYTAARMELVSLQVEDSFAGSNLFPFLPSLKAAVTLENGADIALWEENKVDLWMLTWPKLTHFIMDD
ncbi:hypothetical protein FCM35_KLT13569 [Carex littledalei]|uniref:Uncharacterized protein n=1 Tax=Carex littledalei TaxID=544730 RepID=A0A833QF09_9POAL|nr:hypothetical protein FCM35_KLT13569 [Carex littledalei]